MKKDQKSNSYKTIDIMDMKGIFANSLSTMNAVPEFCEDMRNITVYKQSYQSRPALNIPIGADYDANITDADIDEIILGFIPLIDDKDPLSGLGRLDEILVFCTNYKMFYYRTQLVQGILRAQISYVELRDYQDAIITEINFGSPNNRNKPTYVRNSLTNSTIIITGQGQLVELTFSAGVPVARLLRLLADLPTPDGATTQSQITVYRVNCGTEVAEGVLLGGLYGVKGDNSTGAPATAENLYLSNSVLMIRGDYLKFNPTVSPKPLVQYFDIACIGMITALEGVQTGAFLTTTEQLWYLEKSEEFLLGYIPQTLRKDITCPLITNLLSAKSDAGIFIGSNILYANMSSFRKENTDLPDYDNVNASDIQVSGALRPLAFRQDYPRRNLVASYFPNKETIFFYRLNEDGNHQVMSIDYGTTSYGYHEIENPFSEGVKVPIFATGTYQIKKRKKGVAFFSSPVTFTNQLGVTKKVFGLYLEQTQFNSSGGIVLSEQMYISRTSTKINPMKATGALAYNLETVYINVIATNVKRGSFILTAFAYDQHHNIATPPVVKDLSSQIDAFGNIPEKFIKTEIKFQGKFSYFQFKIEMRASSCVISRIKLKVSEGDL